MAATASRNTCASFIEHSPTAALWSFLPVAARTTRSQQGPRLRGGPYPRTGAFSKVAARPLAALLAALLVGCGTEAPPAPSDPADAYALKKSSGQHTGCSDAKPGPEAARHPGCIYSAALAGCAAALDGRPDPATRKPRPGDFTEPQLRAVMATAYKDCSRP